MATLGTEITVTLPNRTGQLAAVTDTLGKAGVNIQSLAGSTGGGKGTIRMLFADKDAARARRALQSAGYRVGKSSVRKVLLVSLAQKPGTLARAAGKLAKAGVNLDSVYMAGATRKRVTAAIGVGKNVAKARRALS